MEFRTEKGISVTHTVDQSKLEGTEIEDDIVAICRICPSLIDALNEALFRGAERTVTVTCVPEEDPHNENRAMVEQQINWNGKGSLLSIAGKCEIGNMLIQKRKKLAIY